MVLTRTKVGTHMIFYLADDDLDQLGVGVITN